MHELTFYYATFNLKFYCYGQNSWENSIDGEQFRFSIWNWWICVIFVSGVSFSTWLHSIILMKMKMSIFFPHLKSERYIMPVGFTLENIPHLVSSFSFCLLINDLCVFSRWKEVVKTTWLRFSRSSINPTDYSLDLVASKSETLRCNCFMIVTRSTINWKLIDLFRVPHRDYNGSYWRFLINRVTYNVEKWQLNCILWFFSQ